MYRIEAIAPVHIPGYRLALDQLVREDRYFAIERTPSLAEVSAQVQDALALGSAHWVALVHGRVVGWCDIVPSMDVAHIGILRMGIEAAHRGCGIGTALMRRSIDAAWEKGMTGIVLEIYNASPDAARFCARAGFVESKQSGRAAGRNDLGATVINMALKRRVQ